MHKQGQFSITIVCIILGIMLAVQFRTTQDIRSSAQYERADDLMKRIMQVEKERTALEDQVHDLHQPPGDNTVAKDLERIKIEAGLVPLQGTGVIITIDDTKQAISPSKKNPNLSQLKDEDILKILNELRAAGAEAIAINNQRLIATSEVRTAGSFISINNKNFTTPFEIKAIGDPTALENALKIRGGIIETIQFWGIQVVVKQSTIVELPAFKGTFRFQYAHPDQNGGK